MREINIKNTCNCKLELSKIVSKKVTDLTCRDVVCSGDAIVPRFAIYLNYLQRSSDSYLIDPASALPPEPLPSRHYGHLSPETPIAIEL